MSGADALQDQSPVERCAEPAGKPAAGYADNELREPLPATMKALQIVGVERAMIVELPMPEPGAGQALVKVKAATTCPQWDLHIYYGKPMFVNQQEVLFPYEPGQPGHEMTGTVVRIGEGCGLRPGQTVCAWKDPGHQRPGCYAEYVVMDEQHLIAVPPELDYRQVASLELAMCVGALILKMRRAQGIAGKRVGVCGLGPSGVIAAQMLAAEGAKQIIGIDPHPGRRTFALEHGATAAYAPGSVELGVRKGEGAFDLAIDCVGFPEAFHDLLDRTNGAVGLFAVQRHDFVFQPKHRGLDFINYPGHSLEAAEYALALIVQSKLDLSCLASREMRLDEYEQAVNLLKNQEAIKICFIP